MVTTGDVTDRIVRTVEINAGSLFLNMNNGTPIHLS